jgi:hypothetical protein
VPVAAAVVAAGVSPVVAATATASDPAPVCQAPFPGGPVFITDTCTDPVLNQPYLDVPTGQLGSKTDPATGVTVSYLYFHGGFTGTNARFSFYFPLPASGQYKGRFFETTFPTVSQEDAIAPSTIVFTISNGAYVVSSNNAGGVPAGGRLAGYRANAAAAKYSRVVAAQVYPNSARPRGYIYGGSGGAYQTLGAMENTSGVWDGGVPFVPGVPNAIPSFMTVELLALRILGDKLPQIADAVAPGGSGDPFAGLSPLQQSVLQEVTRLGFPLRGWWQYATLNGGAFFIVELTVRAVDPCYGPNTNPQCSSADGDFWTQPGYEGSDPTVQAARIQHDTTVTGVAGPRGVILASVPTGDLNGADLLVTSGPAAGQTVPIVGVNGTTIQLLFNPGITSGNGVRLDNSWLIALQYYQRHQVPSPDQYGWNQYRGPDGAPLEPQRPFLAGPILAASAGGAVATGHFHGKMIMLGMTMDVQAYPWSADWYRQQAQAALGSSFADNYRLWYMDNADHVPPASTGGVNAADHVVNYTGELQQALLDLDAWVANGVQPSPSTSYNIDDNDQVQLADQAAQRHGVQPVVTLSARAGAHTPPGQRIDVTVGQPVTLSMKAQVPPGTGDIVKVEWDFQGTGSFSASTLTHIGPVVNLHESYTFTQPGTYFPVVLVTSQRDGNADAPYAGLIQNLASVRVVVH